jgi:23S rRNA G2445 N2-methylase RlmL
LRSAVLDAVVTNLPFGEQIGTHAGNEVLYASVFRELARTLRLGGRAVLLSSEKELMRRLIGAHRQLTREREVLVGVLGQAARITVLLKTGA